MEMVEIFLLFFLAIVLIGSIAAYLLLLKNEEK